MARIGDGMGLFGGSSIVGLDIGTSSIKAVRLQAAKNGWDIVAAARVETPRGAVADGMIADERALLPAMHHLFAQIRARRSAVIAAVNFTSGVSVRRVGLPVLTPEALRKQIQTQPDLFGLSPGTEQIHDFEILGTHGEGTAAQMDTLLVSAQRTAVECRLHLLESAGLEPVAMDIEPFALMRSLVEVNPALSGLRGAIGILDLGAVHTDVTVVRGTNYIFTRAIPLGGNSFTAVVQQALECTLEKAEKLKTEIDLNWLLQGPGEQADTPAYQATAAIKSVLDDLLREVRNSILFYQSQLPDDDVEDGMVAMILLAGGTALMKGLPEYMQAAFSLQVQRADCSWSLPYRIALRDGNLGPEESPLYALAAGLAAREPVEQARRETANGGKRRARGKKADAEPAPAQVEEPAQPDEPGDEASQ